jgi:hypothetical protein
MNGANLKLSIGVLRDIRSEQALLLCYNYIVKLAGRIELVVSCVDGPSKRKSAMANRNPSLRPPSGPTKLL